MAKKTNIQLRNPFVYQGYVSPDYFCDRIVETEELIGICKTDAILCLSHREESAKRD